MILQERKDTAATAIMSHLPGITIECPTIQRLLMLQRIVPLSSGIHPLDHGQASRKN